MKPNFGQKRDRPKARAGHAHKFGVLALADRESGTMHSFTFDRFSGAEVHPIVIQNISREARLIPKFDELDSSDFG